MKREKITISEEEISTLVHEENETENFEFVQDEQVDYDTEKGSSTFEIIVQRKSDDKYFRGTYTKWPAGGIHYESDFDEVKPKTIKTVVFE